MRRFTEPIKTFTIAILVFLMLILWTQNMRLRFSENTASATSLQHLDSGFWIFTDSTNTHSEVIADPSYLSPVGITLVADSKAYSSATNTALTSSLWKNTLSLVKEVFSSSYTAFVSNADTWEKELCRKDFILIEFPSSIPYMTLCAFENKSSSFLSGDIFSVKELLLYPNDNSTVTALCNDGKGNVYSLEHNADSSSPLIYDFNSNNLTAYTVNKELIPSTIVAGSTSLLPAHHSVLSEAPVFKKIEITNILSSLFDAVYSTENVTNFALISNRTIISLLENFNINPSTVGVYTDASGRLIFINTNTRLALGRDGNIEYNISRDASPQIMTSELLESERTHFSSFEQVAAVTEFLNLFKGVFIGEDTELLLESVTHDSGNTEYVFGYYYNLCRITSPSRHPEARIVFNSKGLVSASITPIAVIESEKPTSETLVSNLSESVALSLINPSENKSVSLAPVYSYSEYNTPTLPVWSIVSREVDR